MTAASSTPASTKGREGALITRVAPEQPAHTAGLLEGDLVVRFRGQPIADAATLHEIIVELETTTTSERAGRAMDHEREDAFERLRASGYM